MIRKNLTKLLFEDTPPQPDPNNKSLTPVDIEATMLPSNISLDQKIDKYIMQYERESSPSLANKFINRDKPIPNIPESLKLNKINSLQKFLFEADEPGGMDLGGGGMDDAGGGGMDLGGGGGLGDIGGSGDSEKKFEPPVPTPSPKLNLNNFASRIATLVQNYDSLIDPRTVILNRVQAYMNQNYSKQMSEELMIKLKRDFGLSSEPKEINTMGPTSVAAGASGLEPNSVSGGSLTGGE